MILLIIEISKISIVFSYINVKTSSLMIKWNKSVYQFRFGLKVTIILFKMQLN